MSICPIHGVVYLGHCPLCLKNGLEEKMSHIEHKQIKEIHDPVKITDAKNFSDKKITIDKENRINDRAY